MWLGSLDDTPCTRCWATSPWWDFSGSTPCWVTTTRPSRSSRTSISTRRYNLFYLHSDLVFTSLHTSLPNVKLFLLGNNLCLSLQNMYSRVPACQITTYYYVGFAYMMMRRYQDAIRTLSNILLYIQRTKQMFQNRTYLYDQVISFCCLQYK